MSNLDGSPQTVAENFTEETQDTTIPGPVERGINTMGLTMTVGGYVVSLIKPEIGNVITGAGVGLVVGGLAVGYAIRRGNG